MGRTQTPFNLVAAFTSSPFGGNPAAVVFLDATSPTDLLGKISQNLNQPITTFISPDPVPSANPQVLKYLIKFYVSNGQEQPLCGHGTLAASKLIFSTPATKAANVHTIQYTTGELTGGATMIATKWENDFIQIDLPSTVPGHVSDEEKARLKTHVDRAFGRDVKINDIKTGCKEYKQYLMIELDVAEDLAGSTIDAAHFLGSNFVIHILTTTSPDPNVEFISRMFSPLMIGSPFEDAVCGSAHGILSPYWYTKKGISSGKEIRVKQVSPRGGDLRIVWEKEEGRVKLRGQCTVLASGHLHL